MDTALNDESSIINDATAQQEAEEGKRFLELCKWGFGEVYSYCFSLHSWTLGMHMMCTKNAFTLIIL